MAYQGTILKVMLASPGDVGVERRIAQAVVHEWNAVHSDDRRMVLLPVSWELHASPVMGERAQGIINRQVLDSADLLVGMFWTRIGTPTGKAASGTVEEIERHLTAGKPAMLYFSTAPVAPDSLDPEQYPQLRAFRDHCRARGLIELYESPEQFRQKFSRQLAQTIIRSFPPRHGDVGGGTASATDRYVVTAMSLEQRDFLANLPTEARELLIAAAGHPDGTVLVAETMGGMLIEVGERDFVERGNSRSEARWRRAVQELVQRGWLEQRDLRGEVFSVTDEGFRAADLLQTS